MGRRKQHCPKKTNENTDDGGDANANGKEDTNDQGKDHPINNWVVGQKSKSNVPKFNDMARILQLQTAHRLQNIYTQQQRQVNRSTNLSSRDGMNNLLPLDLTWTARKQLHVGPRFAGDLPYLPHPDKDKLYPGFADNLLRLNNPGILPTSIYPFLTDIRDGHKVTDSQHYALSALHRMSELSQIQRNAAQVVGKTADWNPGYAGDKFQGNAKNDLSADIFKCVWCQERYSSLAELTQHLKEAKHGVTFPFSNPNLAPKSEPNPEASKSPLNKKSPSPKPKDSSPVPRKLVRGQDVWLGKGQEQTRQILKCMWCGESFKTLAELTKHMQDTQHYTKVISQEQLTSWKNGEHGSNPGSPIMAKNSNSHGSALTCQVCHKFFPTLSDLSEHMAEDNHFKDSISPASPNKPMVSEHLLQVKRRHQGKEKRKKALPVKKLLELERECGLLDTWTKPEKATSTLPEPTKGALATNSSGNDSILGSLEKMVEDSFSPTNVAKTSKNMIGIIEQISTPEESQGKSPHDPGPLEQLNTDQLQNLLKKHSLFNQVKSLQRNLMSSMLVQTKLGSRNEEFGKTILPDSSSHNPLDALKEMCGTNEGTTKRKLLAPTDDRSSEASSEDEKEIQDEVKRRKFQSETDSFNNRQEMGKSMDHEKIMARSSTDSKEETTGQRHEAHHHGGGDDAKVNDDESLDEKGEQKKPKLESKFLKYSELAKQLSSR